MAFYNLCNDSPRPPDSSKLPWLRPLLVSSQSGADQTGQAWRACACSWLGLACVRAQMRARGGCSQWEWEPVVARAWCQADTRHSGHTFSQLSERGSPSSGRKYCAILLCPDSWPARQAVLSDIENYWFMDICVDLWQDSSSIIKSCAIRKFFCGCH